METLFTISAMIGGTLAVVWFYLVFYMILLGVVLPAIDTINYTKRREQNPELEAAYDNLGLKRASWLPKHAFDITAHDKIINYFVK